MILPRYHIAASAIHGAGNGLFLDEAVAAGSIITAPDGITETFRYADIMASTELRAQFHASARWFEDRYTLSPEWPDECFINHSFAPNGLWHLGFVFALTELSAGSEITVDYRHLLPPGTVSVRIDPRPDGTRTIRLATATVPSEHHEHQQ